VKSEKMTKHKFKDSDSLVLKKSYESVGKIQFDQSNFRKDIGFDLIKKPQKA